MIFYNVFKFFKMKTVVLSKSGKNISRILHLSDIHIRLYQHHERYQIVFNQLYAKIRQEQQEQQEENFVIVITGDLLHSKNQLSPECTNLTIDFLENLAKLSTTFLIAGNHDALLENSSRLDSISSILYKRAINNLHYLKYSGVYTFENINFYVDSLLDHETNIFQNPKRSKNIKVALYHGQITGWKNNLGYESPTGEKSIAEFDKMDYVLLGDIHKHQFMTKRMAYSGSLISQNCGESDDFHGFLLWNLDDGTTTFHKIQNEYRYIDLVYDALTNRFLIDSTYYDIKNLSIPKFANCRIFSNSTNVDNKLLLNRLQEKFPGAKFQLKCTFTQEDNVENVRQLSIEDEKETAIKYIKSKCTDKKMQNQIINEIMPRWQEICSKQENVQWELVRLEFSNMFRYGEDNIFVFSSSNHIFGIFGENACGKSSFADVITYLLCGKITRYSHGNSVPKELINHHKDKAFGSIVFRIGHQTFVISKQFSRQHSGKIKVSQKFYSISGVDHVYKKTIKELLADEACSELTGEQRKKTDQEIEKIIGNFYYFTFINFFFQQGEESFRNLPPVKKKKFMIDLFGYGWMENLEKKYKEELKELMVKSKAFEEKISTDTEESFEKYINQLSLKIESITKDIKKNENNLESKQSTLKEYYSQLFYSMDELKNQQFWSKKEEEWKQFTKITQNELEKLENEIQKDQQDIDLLEKTIEKSVHPLIQIEGQNEDEFYQKFSPFFNETKDNWNEQKKKENKYQQMNNAELDKDICALQKEIETQSLSCNAEWKNPLLKGFSSIHEISTKIQEKTLLQERVQKQLDKLTPKLFEFPKEWKESLENYQDVFQKGILLRHEYEVSQRKVEEMNSIDFNEHCHSCMKNPYYMNRLSLEKDCKLHLKKWKENECQIKNYETFFVKVLQTLGNDSKHMNPRFLQDIQEDQYSIQKDVYKYQAEEKKIDGVLKKLENTLNYWKYKEMKEKLEKLKKKWTLLKNEQSCYFDFLEKKELSRVLDAEWFYLENYTKHERKTIMKDNREKKSLLEEKKKTMETKKESYFVQKEKFTNEQERWGEKKEQFLYDVKTFEKILKTENELEYLQKEVKKLQNLQIEHYSDLTRRQTLFTAWQQNVEEWKEVEEQKQFREKLCSLFDKDALPCYMLMSKFPMLEQQINDVIQLFLEGHVRFRMEEKMIELGVETEQGTSSFLSGMESFIVDLAIKLCFSKFSVLPRSNFFLIDEQVSVLDKERLANVSNLLDLLSNITSNVLLISHLPQINDFVTTSINIVKNSKGSCISCKTTRG